ncbi:hypothetical protein NQG72_13125 [Burkholderia pseudomallei]|uniref:hypothetical protein n=1 Tax=Burkholderia pseudomallei TaxID=28450 RepID=UPI002116227F|nr:hypothetical protein [Burkholderia pseudomallei]MCQ8216297.1 hypothetical protein [Burkholderia pseudomallei]
MSTHFIGGLDAKQCRTQHRRADQGDLAGSALSPLQAKLYSQRVRRDMGADGLPSFSPAELTARLDEACLLLDAAWLERSADNSRAWTTAVKRAAEILEWVSHVSLKPADAPIHLLSAAAYQVAGYPAMALGHLRMMPAGEAFSTILREFLRGDFGAALTAVQTFWKVHHDLGEDRVSRPLLSMRVRSATRRMTPDLSISNSRPSGTSSCASAPSVPICALAKPRWSTVLWSSSMHWRKAICIAAIPTPICWRGSAPVQRTVS